MSIRAQNYFCVVVAAGIGQRIGGVVPKQYLPIANRTLLEWSVKPFLALPQIARVVVVLAENDPWFPGLILAQHPKIKAVVGGHERYQSVLSGLQALSSEADRDDWIMVHDAARPNITLEDIKQLINNVGDHPVGGLLGVPLSDSLKCVDHQNTVVNDVAREEIWRALTPQMFRFNQLLTCLQALAEQGISVADEASALGRFGHQCLMVLGRSDNIKVTTPADYEMMEKLMAHHEITAKPKTGEVDL
jgi:2-C-methyl-D-erythritol 4-phosphate cytidylyltransferase